MTRKVPSVRKSGKGSTVLCLHSSTSSSKQWSKLSELLAHRFQVVARDLYGYGDSPAWDFGQTLSLRDELALLEPVLESFNCEFHVIGHSYGAAVALALATAHPANVRSMVLYEPVLFNLLLESDEHADASVEINSVRSDVVALVGQGNLLGAGKRFVNYWSGEGAWDRFEERQKESVAKRMPKVVADFDAVIGNTTPLSAYCNLRIPTLLLYGVDSPRSTQGIISALARTLPKSELRGFLGLGHMGPMTHAEQMALLMQKFLEAQPRGILVHQFRKK